MHKNEQNKATPESPPKKRKVSSFDTPKLCSAALSTKEDISQISPTESRQQDLGFFNADGFFTPDFSFSDTSECAEISDFFSPLSEKTQFRSNQLKRSNKGSFTIHSLSTLAGFLHEMHTNQEKPCLRFLVDMNGHTRFAREHNKRFGSPAHYQMTGLNHNSAYCMTAGNLFLSDDFKTCIKINNKSGDFRPSFDSLKWLLAILMIHEQHLPFAIAEELNIEEFGSSGTIVRKMTWEISSIRRWIADLMHKESIPLILREQEQGSIDVVYPHQTDNERTENENSTEFRLPKSREAQSTPSKKKLMAFFSAQESTAENQLQSACFAETQTTLK